MSHFIPERAVCPICKCHGNCRIHGYYHRHLIDMINGQPTSCEIRIMRLKCSCGHTHAVLCDPIIPYDSHSLTFILHVLTEHFLRLHTIERICEDAQISIKTFYKWLRLYQEHRREWQGLLTSMESDIRSSLDFILSADPFSHFARFFFQRTGISFLQSHANPSHSPRRSVPP